MPAVLLHSANSCWFLRKMLQKFEEMSELLPKDQNFASILLAYRTLFVCNCLRSHYGVRTLVTFVENILEVIIQMKVIGVILTKINGYLTDKNDICLLALSL